MVSSEQKISVIGLGYVGLITAVGLGLKGHKVVGIEVDSERVEKINKKLSPFYEEGLAEAIKKVELVATRNYREVLKSNITFLCVNTPTDRGGSIDLTYIKKSAEELAVVLKGKKEYHLVVVRSTVVPGTTEEVINPILKNSADVGICVNPEFLREGEALQDFMNASRIIIGESDRRSGDILYNLYQSFGRPILRMNLKTAEMVKYASNAFVATKISFINEIGNICKKLGIDIYQVARAMGYDERIGNKCLNAGIGFGGPCLPKDIEALVAKAEEIGYEPRILKEVLQLNKEQPLRIIGLLKKHIPSLKGKVIGILGLAFKPGTDDVRDSKAITIAEMLLMEGAQIRAYDPKAMPKFKKLFPQIEHTNPERVLASDAILILTEWDEFNNLDYRNKIVVDGRRISKAEEAGIYEGICW